jgi:hypothetical protein
MHSSETLVTTYEDYMILYHKPQNYNPHSQNNVFTISINVYLEILSKFVTEIFHCRQNNKIIKICY